MLLVGLCGRVVSLFSGSFVSLLWWRVIIVAACLNITCIKFHMFILWSWLIFNYTERSLVGVAAMSESVARVQMESASFIVIKKVEQV
jgi:hypothetical protein